MGSHGRPQGAAPKEGGAAVVAIDDPQPPNVVWLPFLIETYEPNDSLVQAYGPLVWGREYKSYIASNQDNNDYFFVEVDTGRVGTWIEAQLGVPPGVDLDLWVYDQDRKTVGVSASTGAGVDEQTSFKPTYAGRYYIRVYRYVGWNADEPYTLLAR
jgi:hypothetical protein